MFQFSSKMYVCQHNYTDPDGRVGRAGASQFVASIYVTDSLFLGKITVNNTYRFDFVNII